MLAWNAIQSSTASRGSRGSSHEREPPEDLDPTPAAAAIVARRGRPPARLTSTQPTYAVTIQGAASSATTRNNTGDVAASEACTDEREAGTGNGRHTQQRGRRRFASPCRGRPRAATADPTSHDPASTNPKKQRRRSADEARRSDRQRRPRRAEWPTKQDYGRRGDLRDGEEDHALEEPRGRGRRIRPPPEQGCRPEDGHRSPTKVGLSRCTSMVLARRVHSSQDEEARATGGSGPTDRSASRTNAGARSGLTTPFSSISISPSAA